MVPINTTDILHTLQTADYYDVLRNLISTTYIELAVFTIGIFLYAVFVWFFYRHLSKRDLFKLDLKKYDMQRLKYRRLKKAGDIILYVLKYGIAFPFYVGFWFAILTVLIYTVAENVAVRQVALISVALVSSVRVTSYLSEDLSRDLAKLVPFALLAIFLMNPNFFSYDLLIARLTAIPSLGWEILRLLTFSIILEWILRILYSVKSPGKSENSSAKS